MIRVGLIGCGEYGSRTHARTVSEMEHAQITAISECVFPQELSKRQQEFRIPHSFQSHLDMLRSVELDAVIISTPHSLHYSQVKHCLERSLHVLVDKPPACKSEEVQELVRLAQSANRHLVVASQRRYDPILCRLRDSLQKGVLGELKFVEIYYAKSKRSDFSISWRKDSSLSGGILFDAGYHVFDNLLWVTGLRPVSAKGSLFQEPDRIETGASLSLNLERNASANICVHLDMPDNALRSLIGLYGSKGALIYQYVTIAGKNTCARLLTLIEGHHHCEEIVKDAQLDFAPAKNFIAAILGTETPISSGQESIETVRAIETIYSELNARVVAKKQ